MRIGIFGGSFDPVHYGHLQLAESCRDQRNLDCVWFLPAADPPHKRRQVRATGSQRIDMLAQAVGDNEHFQISRVELDRGGVSFTADTLVQIAGQRPDDELFLLMGSDTLADLPNWHRPDVVCRLALPLVVRRAGDDAPDFDLLSNLVARDRLDNIRSLAVDMPACGLSSSEIRQRVAQGLSIRYLTPPAVVAYIHSQGLYHHGRRG